jgi:hypothetical protein
VLIACTVGNVCSSQPTQDDTCVLASRTQRQPASAAADDRLERSGRSRPDVIHRQRSSKSALSHSAAIVVIGDELLSGKVADCNSGFLATELHRLGWCVCKVSILPDNVDAIARCAARHHLT